MENRERVSMWDCPYAMTVEDWTEDDWWYYVAECLDKPADVSPCGDCPLRNEAERTVMTHNEELHNKALQQPCPYCGAKPGEKCFYVHTRERLPQDRLHMEHVLHQARYRRAKALIEGGQ